MRLARQQPFATSILESAIYLDVKQPTWRDSDHILQSANLDARGSGRTDDGRSLLQCHVA
jgi:hypothetical protein